MEDPWCMHQGSGLSGSRFGRTWGPVYSGESTGTRPLQGEKEGSRETPLTTTGKMSVPSTLSLPIRPSVWVPRE